MRRLILFLLLTLAAHAQQCAQPPCVDAGRQIKNVTAIANNGDLTLNLNQPRATDDGLFQHLLSNHSTILKVRCTVDVGTVDINLQVRSVPNTAGTPVLPSALTCTSSLATAPVLSTTNIPADSSLALMVANVTGSPQVVRIYVQIKPVQ